MPAGSSPRQRFSETTHAATRRGFVALLALGAPAIAHGATMLAGCQPTDSALLCRLRSVLTFLRATAVVLAVLLLLAIAAAVFAARRRSRKLTPKDITTDAP